MSIQSELVKSICLTLSCLLLLLSESFALSPSEVFQKVKDTVVVIRALDKHGKLYAQGSGVIVTSDKVVTNYHVIKESSNYQVRKNKQIVSAKLVKYDEEKDICILGVTGINNATPAQLGQSVNLNIGDNVYAIGAPQGLELSLTNGVVSQLRGDSPPLIQTTAAISHGSSGGGLFNDEGYLVGLTTFYVKNGQNLNFALPVEWILSLVPVNTFNKKETRTKDWALEFNELENKNDIDAMINWALKWTKNEPKSGRAWYNLGVAYDKRKQYNHSIQAYNTALEINRNDLDAWINIGADYYELKNYKKALEAYQNALRINQNDSDVWYNVGLTFDKLKRYKNSIEAYKNALRNNENDEKVWNNIAIAYLYLGDKNSAINAVIELKRYNPNKADSIYRLIVSSNRN